MRWRCPRIVNRMGSGGNMSREEWLKITFDATLPGLARSANSRKLFPGQWIVFDKADGSKPPLFLASTFEECSKWMDVREAK
jgi:hypothetical protein